MQNFHNTLTPLRVLVPCLQYSASFAAHNIRLAVRETLLAQIVEYYYSCNNIMNEFWVHHSTIGKTEEANRVS
jgi:hypothetical protein